MLQWLVTTRLGGTTYGPISAPDADAAREHAIGQRIAGMPAHIPRATAERYARADMAGARVERYAAGIRR